MLFMVDSIDLDVSSMNIDRKVVFLACLSMKTTTLAWIYSMTIPTCKGIQPIKMSSRVLEVVS